jgi:WS/DGAT/MGAT family acyltransferase
VHRLSGEDAGFLYMDLPGQPMNTMAVGVLAPADGPPLTLADLRLHLEARIPQLPSFRWRVVPVPLRLHHPVAVDDPDFDLDFHLRTERVAAPGGPGEVNALFARIAERHLDRRHPLWQATLVDGLEGGRQAVILKYQHCLADGVAAYTTFSRVFSDAPRDPIPGVAPFAPTRLPGRARLVAGALADHARAAARLPKLAATTKARTDAVKTRRAETTVDVPDFSGQAPRCVLNDAFTPGRAYARAALPLAGLKAVKDAAGVTLNDAVLAVMAGACRRYLEVHGGVPDRPLLTSVPVSDEPADAPVRQAGNRFWSFTTTLATDVDDAWERLQVISTVTREAKEQLTLLGTGLMPAWLDVVPPLVAQPGARALVHRLRTATDLVDANILISNIKGPDQSWELFGRRVEDLYVDGPPSNGVGCNVMVWSYGDRMLFGVLSFADALRDPDLLTRSITDAFDELYALARHHRAAVPVAAGTATP